MSRLTWIPALAVVVALFLCPIIVACGDDDDDDDDDSGSGTACRDAMEYMYEECGWIFYDQELNPLSVEETTNLCESGDQYYTDVRDCVEDNSQDCEAIDDCIYEFDT